LKKLRKKKKRLLQKSPKSKRKKAPS